MRIRLDDSGTRVLPDTRRTESPFMSESPQRSAKSAGGHEAKLPWLPLVGVAGPVIFWVVVFSLGALTPGYSHVSGQISALGAVDAPYQVVQQANFIVLGTGILALAVGLDRRFREGWRPWVGVGLVGVFGVGILGAGVFSPNLENMASLSSALHQVASFAAFFSALVGLPLTSWRLSRTEGWSVYNSNWAVLGITVLIVGAFIVFITSAPDSWWVGIGQRTYAGALTAWVFFHSLMLHHLHSA